MSSVSTLEPTLLLENVELTPAFLPAVSPKPRKARVWTAFATLLLAAIGGWLAITASIICVEIVIGFVMGAQGADGAAIQARLVEIGQIPLVALFFSLIPFQVGMALVVLLAAQWSKEPIKERLGLLTQSGRILGGFKLATLAAFTVSIAYGSLIISSLFAGPPPSDSPISAVIADGSWWSITLLSILLSTIPALVEETLFRGYIQRRVLKRWSPAVAITVSTLLFALMHFDSVQHIIAVVPLGFVTGLLAYRTNSVKPGMWVHAIHNAAVVGISALATVLAPLIGEELLGLSVIGMIGLLGLIGLPAVISLLRRGKTAVAKIAAPEPVRSRELLLPEFALGSNFASTAV
jgi:membrane protease YdiL (CAAX protease family)